MADVAALNRPLERPGMTAAMLRAAQRNTRRCIFGTAEHEVTEAFLKAEQEKLLELDKQRWNFDFEKELPIPSGRYQWCKLNEDGSEISTEKPADDKKTKQTQITDYMRKRKCSTNHKNAVTSQPKVSRRSST